jgi:hypothetical protein
VSTLTFSPVEMNSGTWISAPVSSLAGLVPQVVGGVAHGASGHPGLVVVLGVHEDEVLALAEEVLHLALVDVGDVHLHAGVEGPVHHLAGHHVLQLGAHEGAALAGLYMLELDDGPEVAVEVQGYAVLQVVRGRHVCHLSRARMPALSHGEQFPSGGRKNLSGRRLVPAIGRAGPHDKDILDPDAALAG